MKEYRLRSRKKRLLAARKSCADLVTLLYPQNLALTSQASGGRSDGIDRMPTIGHGVYLVCFVLSCLCLHLTPTGVKSGRGKTCASEQTVPNAVCSVLLLLCNCGALSPLSRTKANRVKELKSCNWDQPQITSRLHLRPSLDRAQIFNLL
jgi:hypothetical protein